MSHHEGVSCDSCNKSNFSGKRYKCLVCFDYDLCSGCYNSGVTTTRHQVTHPMQCIITRSDFELFYGGESLQYDNVASYSYVCPHCGNCGLTHSQLYDHVMVEHMNQASEVICPVCAVLPGGHPNHMTDDLSGHLSMEHKPSNNRDMEEPLSRNIRRMFHPVRNIPPPRSRRPPPQQAPSGGASNAQNGVSSFSSRESFDPIAELLTQLSGVRRAAQQQSAATTASQLQILQQQLQFERMQVQQARERLERLPRKQPISTTTITAVSANNAKKSDSRDADSSNYLLNQYYEKCSNKGDNKEVVQRRKQQEQFTKEMLYSLFATETLSLSHTPPNQSEKVDKGVTTDNIDKESARLKQSANTSSDSETDTSTPQFDGVSQASSSDSRLKTDSPVKTEILESSNNSIASPSNSNASIRKAALNLSETVDVITKNEDSL